MLVLGSAFTFNCTSGHVAPKLSSGSFFKNYSILPFQFHRLIFHSLLRVHNFPSTLETFIVDEENEWEKLTGFINSEHHNRFESLPFEKLSSKHYNWVLEFYIKPPKILWLKILSTYRCPENNKQVGYA